MEKIIYKMTDDLIDNFHVPYIREAVTAQYIIDNLSTEDYEKLHIANIEQEINAFYESMIEERNNNFRQLDELLHFYYPDLLSYDIVYNEYDCPTGEVIVCIP